MLQPEWWIPAIGAVIGFVLAQLVSGAKIARDWWSRPRLRIETLSSSHQVLAHSTQISQIGYVEERKFAFIVRNAGRSVAEAVQFQVLKIEIKERGAPDFADVFDGSLPLHLYRNADRDDGSLTATIVPRAGPIVSLASWREDYGVIFPETDCLPDYYEEICASAKEYRFSVVAFGKNAKYVTAQFVLDAAPRRRETSTDPASRSAASESATP